MTKIKAIRNHVVFQMEGNTVQHMNVRQFEENTNWGFTYVRADDSTSSPRWGKVISVGHECPDIIQPGMRILIEPLKWTEGVKFAGEMFWRTDSDSILGYEGAA